MLWGLLMCTAFGVAIGFRLCAILQRQRGGIEETPDAEAWVGRNMVDDVEARR